ncbi:MAG TPA: YqgE/AlgH family protein [Gammaproteobacteria bacterium]
MQKTINLTNHFLIAMPNLLDPNFYRSVTYVCQHNEQGAIGLILTRTSEIRLLELLQQLDIKLKPEVRNTAIMYGGPVDPFSGFILHRPHGNWDTTLAVTDEIGLTTSRDVLDAIGGGTGPSDSIVALGYAGWGEGQLESEMLDNAWLTLQADAEMLFKTPPDQLWHAAAQALGIDITRLSGDVGHA